MEKIWPKKIPEKNPFPANKNESGGQCLAKPKNQIGLLKTAGRKSRPVIAKTKPDDSGC
jgi:hypothetical protein